MIKELKVGKRYWLACKSWEWLMGQTIPVETMAEYENFYLVKSLPHKSKPFNFGTSTPFEFCVNKGTFIAQKGDIAIYER